MEYKKGEKVYIVIDLKSFYASVECRERGLDPMKTNLVVADPTRTEKTICLAVTPSLKAYGISGRARLFEVVQKVKGVNFERKRKAPGRVFSGSSYDAEELKNNPDLELDYIVAPPRMALYVDYSTRIYDVYLKYVAPEDMHVYSIDEVFIDATAYLEPRGMTPREFTKMIIKDVFDTTGITAAAGIGTNMYLCKVAMDIEAKKIPADQDGVRIAELDEIGYRRKLWEHTPITDFWRVGKGYEKRLESHCMFTMGDVARCSLYREDVLYKLFGVNAELLIDHAWGWEPCTIADIKAYRPETNSISSGQVLQCPYDCEKTRLVVREMADLLSLDLVDKELVTDQIVLTIGYDIENLTDPVISKAYKGEITIDHYGRKVPKHAHGTVNLAGKTSSTTAIVDAVMGLYDRIIDPRLLTRRITIAACKLTDECSAEAETELQKLDLFTDYSDLEEKMAEEKAGQEREKNVQKAMIGIKKRFGKNAVIKGMNLEEGATAKERNQQIGGHKA